MSTPRSTDKPHIVFLLSDQHNPAVIGAAGDPTVRTPHLDSLCREGTALGSCYCASPLSVPSRMSMLAGQLPSRTGAFTNSHTLRSDQATFVHSLTRGGYQTVLCGRMHFVGPDQRHGYVKRLVGDITPLEHGADRSAYGPLAGTPGQHASGVRLSGPGRSNVIDYDEAVAGAAEAFLHGYDDDAPLFLTVGFYAPHCPYVCPRDLFEYYYKRLPMPSVPNGFEQSLHPAVRKWLANRDMDQVTPPEVRRARAAYYGLTELIDRHVGRVLAAIDRTLGRENTMVIYASDHGDMIGHNGLFWKSNFYEGSVRVPMVFRWPGRIAGGCVIAEPTSLLDLCSTLTRLTRTWRPPQQDGRSLLPALLGDEPADPDRVVFSQLADAKGDGPSAMIRWRQWKLIAYHGHDRPQLFDLSADPAEQHDVGAAAQHAAVRQDLRARLAASWDSAAVAAQMEHWGQHAGLIAQANQTRRAQPAEDGEQWRGRAEHNYIEPWP